jgi:hypothetical protein
VLTIFKIGGCAPVVWLVPANLPGQGDPWFEGDPCDCRDSRTSPPSAPARSRNRRGMFPERDSGHTDTTGTISITVRVLRTSWNAMKPRIQCVLAQ